VELPAVTREHDLQATLLLLASKFAQKMLVLAKNWYAVLQIVLNTPAQIIY
jgi:hypothetical protein